jgi:thioredoxin reductase
MWKPEMCAGEAAQCEEQRGHRFQDRRRFRGHRARGNTQIFQGQIDMDANGYIITHDGTRRTSLESLRPEMSRAMYRQAISAAGTGCMAAIDAERFLEHSEH